MSRVQWIVDEEIAAIFEEDVARLWGGWYEDGDWEKVGEVFGYEEDEGFCNSFILLLG